MANTKNAVVKVTKREHLKKGRKSRIEYSIVYLSIIQIIFCKALYRNSF